MTDPVFGDPDLKALKHQTTIQPEVELRSERMALLIARLEAAEAVCAAASKVVRPKERQSLENAPLEFAIFMALEKWRRTAGI